MEQEETVSIGKNVIENLTMGMYENSRFIFREYVQNSADAIDKAFESGILSQRKEGEIFITIEEKNRQIIFEDNGTGIPQSKVFAALGNIACSEKDRTKDRGFRGIGRLGGLGYCEELIFETSFSGEGVKTIMVWNARGLRQKLLDNNVTEDAIEVVKSVISIKREYEKTDKHYFKVTLKEVDVEHGELLKEKEIRAYLSMVAPIPYKKIFNFREKIYDYAARMQSPIVEYCIYVNEEQLFKPYQTALKIHHQSDDEVGDIQLFKIEKEKLIAWGWYGISQFSGVLNPSNEFRCIRLRKGNIQIGNEQTLFNHEILREERSNNYFIGEIFCVHPDLIPNARRDYFEGNNVLRSLEKFLKEWFHGIFFDLYKTASDYRSAHKEKNKAVERAVEIEEELHKKEQDGFTEGEKDKLSEWLNDKRKAAKEADIKIEQIEKEVEAKKNPVLPKVMVYIKEKSEKEWETKKKAGSQNKYQEPSLSISLESQEKTSEIPRQEAASTAERKNEREPPSDLPAESFEPQKSKLRTDKFSPFLSEEGRKVLDIVFVTIQEILPRPGDEEVIKKIEENIQKAFSQRP